MECYISKDDDRILLVGEANFSFSVDFVNYVEKSYPNDKFRIISTCYESESEISTTASLNVDTLRKKGIQVKCGINATALEESISTEDGLFSRIIFNFPHVGGKMRIERNRKLLRDFLVSARRVMMDSGDVIIALCAGQGGTHVEAWRQGGRGGGQTQRRWDDSWKAVEAAADADLLLISVLPFPSTDLLPTYCSTGYRGLQKSFCLSNAQVHTFRLSQKSIPSSLSQEEIDNLLSPVPVNDRLLLRVHANKVNRNPWKDLSSLQSELFQRFIKECVNQEWKSTDNIFIYCVGGDENLKILKKFNDENGKNGVITQSLFINELSTDFSSAPVECTIQLFGIDALNVAYRTLQVILRESKEEKFEEYLVSTSDDTATIFVDRLLVSYDSSGEWRKLWAGSICSVSPRCYSLDVTFSVESGFSEVKLINVLWSIASDFIIKVQLLSEFRFEDTSKTNYCYRFVYRSYEMPFCRARVIKLHNEVIAKAVEQLLDATII